VTVVWGDTPGESLGSAADAIDFTASGDVSAISVDLGGGVPEERCYRGGAFLPPYTNSARVDRAFALRRIGGWPRRINPLTGRPYPVRVHVDEVPPPVTTQWTTLYERDLRTLASQAIRPTRVSQYLSFTLDEQPWFFHGSNGSLGLANGQGLVCSAENGFHGGNNYAGLHVGLRVYAMAGYDAAKETCVQVRFGGPYLPAGSHVGASHWSGAEQWGYGPGNNHATIRLDSGGTVTFAGSTSLAVPDGAVDPSGLDTWVFATIAQPFEVAGGRSSVRNHRLGLYRRGWLSDAFPNVEQMTVVGAWNGWGNAEQPDFKMGFYLGATPNTNGVVSSRVTHIRVLQRDA
jgi:hypothetical protein